MINTTLLSVINRTLFRKHDMKCNFIDLTCGSMFNIFIQKNCAL